MTVDEVLTGLRRVLSHRVSVAGLGEVALWLGVVYLTIGLVWSYLHPEGVQRIETQLEQRLQLPDFTNFQLAAWAEATVLWPVMTVLPSGGCAH